VLHHRATTVDAIQGGAKPPRVLSFLVRPGPGRPHRSAKRPPLACRAQIGCWPRRNEVVFVRKI